ncbi:hypothetical protein J6590_032332 [Homalodisca vitripennis]|nr:hypothetical protein J6590_032332 [Homalodisca vitripennis]
MDAKFTWNHHLEYIISRTQTTSMMLPTIDRKRCLHVEHDYTSWKSTTAAMPRLLSTAQDSKEPGKHRGSDGQQCRLTKTANKGLKCFLSILFQTIRNPRKLSYSAPRMPLGGVDRNANAGNKFKYQP